MFYFRLSAAAVLVAAVGAFALTPDGPPKTGSVPAAAPAKPAEAATKPVDLVICLDVSGSMQGLIDSAKLKLWDVVNELATMKPTPVLRVALYSYGGEGADYPAEKGYTRQEVALTTDLDEVYGKLSALKITGHIEYVTGVSKRAMDEQKWSTEKDALKLIFVCGNEEANQDPANKIDDVAKVVRSNGVYLNTIYCGGNGDAVVAGWKEVAEKGAGRYANIDMNKASTAAIATPFDKELGELSGKLNTTYVAYGKDGAKKAENQVAQDKNAAAAGPGAVGVANAASRAMAKGGALYDNSTWDLLDRMKTDPKFDIKTVKDEDLCEELRKLKPEEREAYLKKKGEERAELQKQIAAVSAKRAKHIEEESKKAPKSAGEQALDEALKATIRDQAKEKGFTVPAKK